MIYNIKENIGKNGITLEDGQKVYAVIFSELQAKREIELDFTDVRIVASPFLNAAIGQLLRDFTPDDLNHYLKIRNLSSISRPILKSVIENARDYYSSELVRHAVDEAVKQQASDNYGD